MVNEIYLDEKAGVIYVKYHGNQTYDTIVETQESHLAAVKKLETANRPVLILVDATDVGSQDAGARRAGAKMLSLYNFKKMAVVTKSIFIKYLGKFFLGALKTKGQVSYFENEEKALAWLNDTSS